MSAEQTLLQELNAAREHAEREEDCHVAHMMADDAVQKYLSAAVPEAEAVYQAIQDHFKGFWYS
jgi:hypothetical protein